MGFAFCAWAKQNSQRTREDHSVMSLNLLLDTSGHIIA
jgi:hypothetical protein